MDKSLIQIFRGDDTDGLGYQSIQGKITTTLDLTGCRAVFRYLGFTQEFDPIPENGRITITIPASKTSKFPPGLGYASLRVYDSEGKVRTFTNRIPVFVTVYAPSECGGEFEVVFNGGNLELEPLKIKSVSGYRIYDGYLEQIIDKATAIEYGLALLFDSRDLGKDANSGYAATPKAVQAAYDAIIGELTDNYYNAEETEEAIDRIAAYYITSDAQGNPFATYAALAGATVFYSGGQSRTPTRNDYCVVLADETHGGEQYRYIYSVNQQGAGQWEAQYAVGGSIELDNTVTRTSTNGVKSSGIWSAIWGALTAVPGFSSLYDWCVAQLAKKYEKPQNGIPKTDLSAGVQTSLGKADTALQTAPVTSVNSKTGAVSLTASDVGAVPTAGGTMTGQLTVPMLAVGRFYQAITATEDLDGAHVEICGRWFFEDFSGSRITCRDGMETKSVAFLSDIPSVAGLAPLASPAFTGTPTAPTPASGDNSTKVATTAFVKTAISGISVTPLSGQTFDFATTQGVMDALKTVIETLGGTVTNVPTTTISQGE